MGNLVHLRGDPHAETQKLLPWYVTGACDAADRILVEAHLAACAECRADLAGERRLKAAVAQLPDDGGGGWERLAASLTAQDPPRPAPFHVRRIVWFAVAQAALLLLVVGIWTQRSPEPAAYHALGDAPPPQVGNLLVMFAPQTSEQDLRKAIEASRARLVDGPTATGAYVLAIAPDRRSAALAILRDQPGVTLAQPIDAGP